MVDYPVGDLVRERVRAAGVTPFYKCFPHDGVTGPNIATVYSDRGVGVRAPVVFYNRANEAAAQLRPGDFDWDAIFATASAGSTRAACSRRCPRRRPTCCSRPCRPPAGTAPSCPSTSTSGPSSGSAWRRGEGPAVTRRLVEEVDVLVGNEEDMQLALGIAGPEVARDLGA